jgi:hypothetical protein
MNRALGVEGNVSIDQQNGLPLAAAFRIAPRH